MGSDFKWLKEVIIGFFSIVFNHRLLKCALNDEIFAEIIPDLVATNIEDVRVVKSFFKLKF
jgi:hypothetical protein